MFYRLFFISIFSIVTLVANAQEVRVIDNKGTLQYVTRNSVDSSAIAPSNPIEGDVWLDTSNISRIYDGSVWLTIDEDVVQEPWFGTDDDAAATTNTENIYTLGQVGIGNTDPDTNAILDLTNSVSKAFLLPSETLPTNISSPTDGMLVYSSDNKNAYLRADSAWKPIAHNLVTNELIFDGDDDADATNDNFYYVSFVVNGDWKVVRYDKTDVNIEVQATIDNNSGQIAQPSDLSTCSGLTYN